VDFVSFALRVVIELTPEDEGEAAAGARRQRRLWLAERGYRVLDVAAAEVGHDLETVLERVASEIKASAP
jgi:tRNA/rRNA methyltransferase